MHRRSNHRTRSGLASSGLAREHALHHAIGKHGEERARLGTIRLPPAHEVGQAVGRVLQVGTRPEGLRLDPCRTGDAPAFDALYWRYRDWVVDSLNRVVGHLAIMNSKPMPDHVRATSILGIFAK